MHVKHKQWSVSGWRRGYGVYTIYTNSTTISCWYGTSLRRQDNSGYEYISLFHVIHPLMTSKWWSKPAGRCSEWKELWYDPYDVWSDAQITWECPLLHSHDYSHCNTYLTHLKLCLNSHEAPWTYIFYIYIILYSTWVGWLNYSMLFLFVFHTQMCGMMCTGLHTLKHKIRKVQLHKSFVFSLSFSVLVVPFTLPTGFTSHL